MFERLLIVWLVVASAVAYFWPNFAPAGSDPFGASQPYFKWMIFVTMFAVGAMLPRDEIEQVRKRWPHVLFGTLIQYTAMPLLGWGIAKLWNLPVDYQVGLILVGCVPGAMASNVVTMNARGHTSYSVSLTTSSTILSPIVVPFTLWLTLGKTVPLNPLSVGVDLMMGVVAPVLLGCGLVRLFPRTELFCNRWGPVVANLVILWIIAAVVAVNRGRLAGGTLDVILPLIAVNLLGYLAGWSASTAIGQPESMRRALTLEVGMQNAGLGTMIAFEHFKDRPLATVPTALYTFGCVLTAMMLAQYWAARDRRYEQSDNVSANDTTSGEPVSDRSSSSPD
ncbi:MAG TPA: bile acid:sodium symporter family protein [Pirellulaceae bacterium]|nr:bile acid:sodium symporter family protein [Pirellulaceae bacterium]